MLDKHIVIEDLKEIYNLLIEPKKYMVGNFFQNEKIKFKFNELFNNIIHSKKYDANLQDIKNEQ